MFYSIIQNRDRDQSIQDEHDAELEAARREADSFSFGLKQKLINTRGGSMNDTVPRSRLNAVENELSEAKAKLKEVQENALALIGDFQRDVERLDAFERMNRGPSHLIPYYEDGTWRIPYLDRGDGGLGGGVAEMAYPTFREAIDAAMIGRISAYDKPASSSDGLVKALQFYANGKHVKDGIGWDSQPAIEDGEIARAALAKVGAT